MHKIRLGFLLFGILSLSSTFSKGSLEGISLYEASLTCPHVLQNSSADLKGMLLQIKLIINKVEVTPTNRKILNDIQQIPLDWRNHGNNQNIKLDKLLTIFYFLHTVPTIALTSSDLYVYINTDQLKSRYYPPEATLQRLLILINRHLRDYIKKLQSEFATSLNNPNFSIMDLSEKIDMPYQILDNILNTDFVPDYLQMTKILNRDQHTIITFFKKVESSPEFNILFNNNSTGSEATEVSSGDIKKKLTNNGNGIGIELIDSDIGSNITYDATGRGTFYNTYMELLKSRLPILLTKLVTHISKSNITRLLKWPDIVNIKLRSVTMEQLLRLAHISNSTLLEALINDPSQLQPINLEKLPKMHIQIALYRLLRNIQKEMNTYLLSINDLSIRLHFSKSRLESILDGESVMSYYDFTQISQGLWNGRENPIILLRRILKGVSTLYYK